MKKPIIILAAVAFAAMSFFAGCESPEQKVADAQEEVADAKENLADKKYDAKVERKADAKEWEQFKAESKAKIVSNDKKIAELKIRMTQSGQLEEVVYKERIISLEKKNTELRKRMETYDANQNDWASFKREFSKDMENLGQAIEDLTGDSDK